MIVRLSLGLRTGFGVRAGSLEDAAHQNDGLNLQGIPRFWPARAPIFGPNLSLLASLCYPALCTAIDNPGGRCSPWTNISWCLRLRSISV